MYAVSDSYATGWDDGRSGKERSSIDPEYVRGYLDGESALEAAVNGQDREVF
jgi:hypothetical protein